MLILCYITKTQYSFGSYLFYFGDANDAIF